MVWPKGDLGVNRSKCFIISVLPVNSWVRGVEKEEQNRYIEEIIEIKAFLRKEKEYQVFNSIYKKLYRGKNPGQTRPCEAREKERIVKKGEDGQERRGQLGNKES